ncbi:MFS transporter [Herbaspirillum lusitanum]|uniref:MFS transporter n=1 Tax=Herbaspirillum lusitanum TaxID=213312 RepID=UPI003899071A
MSQEALHTLPGSGSGSVPPTATAAAEAAPAIPHSQTAVMIQILSTVLFTFLAYMTIGIPLAVLPGYVHLDLGYSSFIAGLSISVQYLSTFITRAQAGRMVDTIGPKKTVMRGMLACVASGAFLVLAAWSAELPWLSLSMILVSRFCLGIGESLAGTGSIIWGIGRIGATHTARMISWNGIATYGALAIGAPLGVALLHVGGFAAIGFLALALPLIGYVIARRRPAVPVVRGERLAFRLVLNRVLPYGIGLALGTVGFGAIATFITLYYASHQWSNAAFSLTLFGGCFIGSRLLFANSINRFGGFKVAIASFIVEAFGLSILWLAGSAEVAMLGAALAGFGFALVFPSLGVEAVGLVPAPNRGAALGAYSVFLDLALGITGPLAGLIVGQFGYEEVFLFAAIGALCAVALTLSLYRRSQHYKTDNAN